MTKTEKCHAIIEEQRGNLVLLVLGKGENMRAGKKAWADNHFGYPFRQNDGGRSQASKKYWGDCGPIAMAIASGRSYDECSAELKEQSGSLNGSTGTNIEGLIHQLEWEDRTFYGIIFERISFPAEKGKDRMRAGEFCKKFPTGRYVLRVSRHYIACVDGVVMGEYPIEPDRCIYAAIKISNVEEMKEAA